MYMWKPEKWDGWGEKFWNRTDLSNEWLMRRAKILNKFVNDLKIQKLEFINKGVGDFTERIDQCSELVESVRSEIAFLLTLKNNLAKDATKYN